jgi:ubiquinone/menaquinone biosynthesis C-methylase UbiE
MTPCAPESNSHQERELLSYYEAGDEARRLEMGAGPLEYARTKEILKRLLPGPPAVILDVGGGPGAYACYLATIGYQVHLIDPVALHVEQARRSFGMLPGRQPPSADVGDARRLPFGDASADAVLLLGPLYHLTDRAARVAALRESRRVLREGGLLLAAGISRFASMLDGLVRDFLEDPRFAAIAARDLADGQHRNPTGEPAYFTTAFFHRPEDLRAEVQDAGLRHEAMLAVEGPGWLLQDLDARWKDPVRREILLRTVRAIEREESLLGASAHLLAVARRVP